MPFEAFLHQTDVSGQCIHDVPSQPFTSIGDDSGHQLCNVKDCTTCSRRVLLAGCWDAEAKSSRLTCIGKANAVSIELLGHEMV